MKDIQAVLFDFDNTLGNRYRYAYLTYNRFLDEFVPQAKEDKVLREEMLQNLLTWDQLGNVSQQYVMRRLAEEYDLDLGDLDPVQWWIENQYKNVCVFPDCVDTLKELKKRYRLGILSNGNSFSQHRKIDHSGIREFFDVIVVSGDLAFAKPDVRIFEYTAGLLGLRTRQCVMVGDTFSKDISGALRSGMTAVWMWPDDISRPCSLAVPVIHRLSELPALLEQG
jgi:putative hydrolase of the HAD superfamily